MSTRLYVVENGNNAQRLVDAKSQAAAERYVASPIRARLATQRDIVTLVGQGVPVENAGYEHGAQDSNVGGNPLGSDAE